MTISSLTNRVSYPGTGSTGPFAVTFRIFAAADLRVIRVDDDDVETVLELTTDYTLTGIGNAQSVLTLIDALEIGETLVLRRAPSLTQPTSLQNNSSYFAKTHEDEFDRLVMQVQALKDQLDQALGIVETLGPSGYSLKVRPETGKVLAWQSPTELGNSTLDSSAVALPGAGRTVATLSAFLLNNLGGVFNVKDYGAIGDGITDDTVAIQTALTACCAAHGKLFFPKGTYLITSTLGAAETTYEWSIEGQAPGGFNLAGAVIKWGGALGGTMLLLAGNRWNRIDSISFDGASVASIGIQWRNSTTGAPHNVASYLKSRDVLVRRCGIGLYLGEADITPGISNVDLYDFQSWDCSTGIYVDNGGAQNFKMFGGLCIGGDYGVRLFYGGFFDFYGTNFENNVIAHVHADGASAGGKNINFHGGYAETGTLVSWGNHNGGSINIVGLTKVENAAAAWALATAYALNARKTNGGKVYYCILAHLSDAAKEPGVGGTWATYWVEEVIIRYLGGSLRINSIGNSWNKSIDLSANVGSNDLLVFSVGDQFTAGSWTRSSRTFVVAKEGVGTTKLQLGTTFEIDNVGGQTRLAPVSIPAITGATPSVAAGIMFELSQGGATNVTDFLNGKDGQIITMRSADANSTIKQDAAKIQLRGAVDVVMALNRTITFVRSGIWYEIARNF